MDLLERTRPTDARTPTAGPGPTGNAEQTRRDGEDFLSAADEAISRGLSVDSAQFLQSTLQEGGE